MARSSAYIPKLCLIAASFAVATAVVEASTLHSPEDQATREDCSKNMVYKSAKALLANANRAMLAKNYADANRILDMAIQKLGTTYQSDMYIDDTGTKLTLADAEGDRGNLSVSANLKKNALTSRLEMYRKTHRCT